MFHITWQQGPTTKEGNNVEEGVKIIQKQYPKVNSLRNATMVMLDAVKDGMDPIVYNRCTYIIQEKERVLEAVQALKRQ